MTKTITAFSDGSVNVNTGKYFVHGDGVDISSQLQSKFDQIVVAIGALGCSELHSEKDDYRQFEHAVFAGSVQANDFGSVISASDFDWIMSHIDEELDAAEAARILAEQQAASEPEVVDQPQ